MPRAKRNFIKSGPAIDPADDTPDRGAAAQQRVVHTPVGVPVNRPAGAPASVFDLAKRDAASAKSKRPYTAPFDPAQVAIAKGVPLSENRSGRDDRCKVLLDRMAPGDSVVLTHIQAKSVKAAGKRLGVELTCRRVSETETGIWRLA